MVESVAIITISDTCVREPNKDTSGPALQNTVQELYPKAIFLTDIIPDEKGVIQENIIYYADEMNIDLILTTGGTGLSKRDVTPEATREVIDRDIPGINIAIAVESLKITPMAMISRAVAGVRKNTLILNFPGSKKAAIECFNIVKPILSHAIALIKGDAKEVTLTHQSIQKSHICPHEESNVDITKVAFRPRESPYPMISMTEAFSIADDAIKSWFRGFDVVGVEEGLGRIIAKDVTAEEPFPPFPASIKDGYACLSEDGAGPRTVRAAVTAGDAPETPLRPRECARVNTGAAIPPGADCVVQVEDTKLLSASEDGKTELMVDIIVPPTLQQDVRTVGSDIPLGAVLAHRGAILDAALAGVLAGAGVLKIEVFKRPRVALLSTGNELQEPYEPKLKPSHIRDSNRTMLRLLLREHGYESIDCGIARDEPAELGAALRKAFAASDIVVCTGGVSMGERDLLKPVLLQDFGATLHFGRVKMKPGKPTTFATCTLDGEMKYIFALPGNPVSAYVCCLLFVVRALRLATGLRPYEWPRLRVRLAHDYTLDPRPEYARATLHLASDDGIPVATLIGNQRSSRLLSACGATVLVELPPAGETKRIEAGSILTALITGRLNCSD
ncbi:Molybdenum cofactor synthesis protein cinnamon [Eumeta japonica]|uniref:Molybdenum cofactor synthesis protein cinnamon n=1 Tax=Eumeta variegata TaxID=151549 RepID=A0A4C1XQZ8_EUMVA|nr:Molybdenum cofactor synthesis protein cinnamon [Eumeta japonica]